MNTASTYFYPYCHTLSLLDAFPSSSPFIRKLVRRKCNRSTSTVRANARIDGFQRGQIFVQRRPLFLTDIAYLRSRTIKTSTLTEASNASAWLPIVAWAKPLRPCVPSTRDRKSTRLNYSH